MRRFRYCLVIRPMNNMSWRFSFFTLAKLSLLVILLTGSLVQTKEKFTSKSQLKKSENSKSKLRSNLNKDDTVDDDLGIIPAFCWRVGDIKKKFVEAKSPLPLTKNELNELIRDIANVLTGRVLDPYTHTEENYESIKNKLKLYGYLSNPTIYTPEHELYNQLWNSFTWRNPPKRFASPNHAQQIIKQLDDYLLSSSKFLSNFFKKQPLYFDNNSPRKNKFPTSPAASYKLIKKFKVPERLKHLMPSNMSVVEAIEDAQNMLSFESSGRQYRLRHLNITTINLEKCSSSGGNAPPTSALLPSVPPPSVAPSSVPGPINCGKQPPMTKMMRYESDPGEWPWMALLMIGPKGATIESAILCGGVLISERHILTAANCIKRNPPENVRVYLGEYDLKKLNNSTTVLESQAERIFVHELYDHQGQNEHDIALIKLKKKTPYNEYIRPICLPPPSVYTYGINGQIAGWATTSAGGKPKQNLLQKSVPIWSNLDCQNSISPYSKKIISTQQLCGGRDKDPTSSNYFTCEIDSGGPIMTLQSAPHHEWIIVGVASWDVGCSSSRPNVPGVFTRVSSYLDWINPKLLL